MMARKIRIPKRRRDGVVQRYWIVFTRLIKNPIDKTFFQFPGKGVEYERVEKKRRELQSERDKQSEIDKDKRLEILEKVKRGVDLSKFRTGDDVSLKDILDRQIK